MNIPLKAFVFFAAAAVLLIPFKGISQNAMGNKDLRINLSENGNHFIKFSGYVQVWGRYTNMNPGTTVNDEIVDSDWDLSLRRYRLNVSGMLTDKLFFTVQLGNNNLNYLKGKNSGVKILDANAEYRFSTKFNLGAGKCIYGGPSRFSAPSTSKMLTYDMVLVAIPMVNKDNDVLRNFQVYTKGQLGKLDYRLALSKPVVQESASEPELNTSDYAYGQSTYNLSGYFKYMFKDKESNSTNWHSGTYLGSKDVINLGVGFKQIPELMWHSTASGDTVKSDVFLWALDFFYEKPLNTTKNTVFTAYAGYFNYDFGPNYIRNIGVDNPANGVNASSASFNGTGNAYPAAGTGQAFYLQSAYLLGKMGPEENTSQLQPYVSLLVADWERLDDQVVTYDVGINWLLNEHLSKVTLNYQSRPIYYSTAEGITTDERRGSVVLQYQWRFQ